VDHMLLEDMTCDDFVRSLNEKAGLLSSNSSLLCLLILPPVFHIFACSFMGTTIYRLQAGQNYCIFSNL
jgi:hypothetical protein